MKLLLLNPPAATPVFRDCYCSGPTKGPFHIHPLDLQVQSGFFAGNGFSVDFLDAVFERLNQREALKRIGTKAPDVVLSLVGDGMIENDRAFLCELKSAFPAVRLFLSGDLARFNPQKTLREIPAAEGLLLDFGSPSLFRYLAEGASSGDLLFQPGTGPLSVRLHGTFSCPRPLVSVVTKYRYRLPFFCEPRYYSIATTFGCPFSCAYCNTHLLGYRVRAIDEIMDELHFASSLGYRSLYIRDATFFCERQNTLSLLDAWERRGLRFQWICFTRPDLIDETLAEVASRMGCCLMMLGVESFDESCLENLSRKIDVAGIRNAFRILRKKKIPSAAMIILGLQNLSAPPSVFQHRWADYEKQLKDFLECIDPDYISPNIYFPRPGVKAEISILKALEKDRARLEKMAERITRNFYFRSRSIQRHIGRIGSIPQFVFQVKTALNILLAKNPLSCRRF